VTTPKRVQLSRRKGYRKPTGAVVVARPSKWGNPFYAGDVLHRFPSLTVEQCAGFVVNEFRDLLRSDALRAQHGYPTDAEIRAHLAGRDLACWCPLDQPCHGDVLLELANGGDA
jgi:hypothetical protein